jgi:catechol 2,3-dioxygenase-like lactoylglutathione lyase family enzyme
MLQVFVTGPDQFRLELTEDPAVLSTLVGHHLHYFVSDPGKVQRWYADTLLMVPSKRAQWESADVPGMNLTFAPVPQNRPEPLPTAGRQVDHISFDVKDLQSFVKRLAANGVKVTAHSGKDSELGIPSALLTDPWGTSIELTQGISSF